MSVTDYGYLQTIWDGLFAYIGNPYGVAGLMGNLYAESGCVPYRLQNDYSSHFIDSQQYTDSVNNGTISESAFVNLGLGYGLAQWTIRSRKQGYYDMYKDDGYSSVGDVQLGIAYVIHELSTSYSDVLSVLQSATDITEASTYVLFHYENPEVKDLPVQQERAQYASEIFDLCYSASGTYVSVINGSGSGYYNQGDVVTITAFSTSYQFKEWVIVSGNITLAHPTSITTSFVMTNQNAIIKATYVGQPVPPPIISRKGMPVWMMVRPIR